MKSFVKSTLVLFSFVLFSNSFAADQSYELITLPDQGVQKVVEILDRAKTSIKISMFHLSQKDLVDKIIELGTRGVHVQILLDDGLLEKPSATAIAARITASSGGKNIEIKPSSTGFSITHTKALLIDDSQLLISTINFSNAIDYSRDFGVILTDKDAIAEFDKVFANDWALSGTDQNSTPSLSVEELAWSPVNSKAKIVGLIGKAKSVLNMQVENLGSFEIQNALRSAVRRGVQLRLVMSMCADGTGERNWPFMDELVKGGIKIKVMEGDRDALHPYIHAKFIAVDGTDFFIGSENFSRNSLDYAREVGVVAESRQVVADLNETFEKDWTNAKDFKNATRKCEPYKWPTPPPKQ
jgi:phosphatidylserine/phosphatidylglycerophosphate/cardiolipin synthase-like enzyme